jgi:hypothetical protein
MSYILTGAGANLISWLVLPTSSVSLGASGAVFGLFTISVLVKVTNSMCLSWDNLLLTRYLHDTVLLLSLIVFEVKEWMCYYRIVMKWMILFSHHHILHENAIH